MTPVGSEMMLLVAVAQLQRSAAAVSGSEALPDQRSSGLIDQALIEVA
jgi:hypothetical protein